MNNRISYGLFLSCSLILTGCSTISENVSTLVQSVPLPTGDGSSDGSTGSISLAKIETPKASTITTTGTAQWPNSCDRVHWPAGIAKPGPGALTTVANVMEFAGFKGVKNIVEGGESFVNLISDMEMALPDTTKQAYIYRALGGERNLVSPLSAYRFGDFNLASAKATAISNQTKAQSGTRSLEYASSLALLATVHTDSGFADSNDRAQGYWREAVAIFREQGAATAEGAALIASGRLLVRQGNLRGLRTVVDRLLSLPAQSEPLKMMALPLSAQLDVADGNPTAAFRKLATALQYWDTQLTQGQATTLDISRNLFGPFLEEGLFSTVPQLEGALVLTQAADILTGMGQEKAALKLLDAALTKTRGSAAHYRPERVDIFIKTAETAALENDSARASSSLKTARNMHWWNLVLYNRAVANRSYAQGLERMNAGDYAEAEIWLRHALGWWQTDLGGSAEALRPLNALSRLYLKMGQQQLAAQLSASAVCFADKVRSSGSLALDSAAGRQIRDAYIVHLAVLASNGPSADIATAVRAAQSAVNGLANSSIENALKRVSTADPQLAQLLSQREKIANELAEARRVRGSKYIAESGLLPEIQAVAQREVPPDPQARNVWLSRVAEMGAQTPGTTTTSRASPEDLSAQLDKINQQIAKHSPRSRALMGSTASLQEIQKTLTNDEALLHYVVAEDQTFIIAIDKTSSAISVVRAGRSEIAASVSVLRNSLKASPLKPFDSALAAELHRILLLPVSSITNGKKRLIVVKDGALSQLPFAVLRNGGPQGPWLVEAHSLENAPSASSFVLSRKTATSGRAPQPFIGIGSPILSASNTSAASSPESILGLRGAARSVKDLGELPETETELRAFAKIFGADQGSVMVRDQATETKVRNADMSRYRVLSFATHALVAGETLENDQAALVLSNPLQSQNAREDGLLTASEVAGLKLNADLVILSACNTAAGSDILSAESLNGLARSFFAAGARALLVSNWAVHSEATQKLMTNFAGAYQKSSAKSDALRSAMLSLAQDQQYSHPYYWAPFDIIGS